MEGERKVYKVLNMCDFCANDCHVCDANRVFSKSMSVESGKLDAKESVVACDQYENPINALLSFC